MPFHLGHKLMIDGAAEMCEQVTVLISGGTDIPIQVRKSWLYETYKHTPDIQLLHDFEFDKLEPAEVDEYGTATCDIFWGQWMALMDRYFNLGFDAVFTNDRYGERLAKELNADWVPLDRNREVVPISGTDIRENPDMHYHMLTDRAKSWYHKTVAVVGPESTGKSRLTKHLADFFHAGYVPEFGRTISEIKDNNLSQDDFRTISIGQASLLDAAHNQHRLVFSDTEAYTTRVFANLYLDLPELGCEYRPHAIHCDLDDAVRADHFDLYILLAPTMPWLDDGTRIIPKQEDRENFFLGIEKYLCTFERNYVIINDDSWEGREEQAVKAVYDNWRVL